MNRMWPIPEGLMGERIDVALSRMSGISRAAAADLIDENQVWLNSNTVAKSTKVNFGDILEVNFPDPVEVDSGPTVELEIVYSDDDIVVINKPVGVAAHPSPGWSGPTATGSLTAMGHLLTVYGPPERKGIVHRLDVGTSGLMVLAKSERAYVSLKDQFRDRTVGKIYHTLVQGHLDPLSGTIDAPIDRHPGHSFRFAVMASGRPSITHYDTLEMFRHASLLEVHLETGRTHQIRVHMSALRHPCCGDLMYGADPKLAAKLGLERQWLHAVSLDIYHPGRGERMTFTTHYPADLAGALEAAREL
jgi:23S rRNA pseudouridine1911/1915/1917 synthase